MFDMKWYDCIKSHHEVLEQVKTCFKMEKKRIEKKWKIEIKRKGLDEVE